MIKTAAELLQVAALRTRTVNVRDADVRIRELSVRGRQEFTEIVKSNTSNAAAWLMQMSVIDEDGKPLFDEESTKALAEASPEVVEAIAGAILEISGLKAAEKKD
jgi:hypothetical protein